MADYRFDIIMHTLLGEKRGTMALSVLNAHITGFLDILKQRCVLSGKMNQNGRCTLNGTLQTPVRPVFMHATGMFTQDEIHLSFADKKSKYSIHGIRNDKNGGEHNGKDKR